MRINHIVAASRNWAIGLSGKMPWHIKEDLQYFKKTTLGCPIIMGRKTFESIGRALPGRLNIVVSRSLHALPEGVVLSHSLEDGIARAKEWLSIHQASLPEHERNLFIIGGGELYRASLPYIDRIYLTAIEKDFDGDTFYPEVNEKEFRLTHSESYSTSENFSFQIFERNSPGK